MARPSEALSRLLPASGSRPYASLFLAAVLLLAAFWPQPAAQSLAADTVAQYRSLALFEDEFLAYGVYLDGRYPLDDAAERLARYNAVKQGAPLSSALLLDMATAAGFSTWLAEGGRDLLLDSRFPGWQQKREVLDAQLALQPTQRFSLRKGQHEAYRWLTHYLLAPAPAWMIAAALALLMFGLHAEARLGHRRFIACMVSGAILAAIAVSLSLPQGAWYASPLLLLAPAGGLALALAPNTSMLLLSAAVVALTGAALPAMSTGAGFNLTVVGGVLLLTAAITGGSAWLLTRRPGVRDPLAPDPPGTRDDPGADWPEDFRQRFAEGSHAMEKADFAQARQCFLELHKAYPDHPALVAPLFHLSAFRCTERSRPQALDWAQQHIQHCLQAGEAVAAADALQRILRQGADPKDLRGHLPLSVLRGLIGQEQWQRAEGLLDLIMQHRETTTLGENMLKELLSALEAHDRSMQGARIRAAYLHSDEL